MSVENNKADTNPNKRTMNFVSEQDLKAEKASKNRRTAIAGLTGIAAVGLAAVAINSAAQNRNLAQENEAIRGTATADAKNKSGLVITATPSPTETPIRIIQAQTGTPVPTETLPVNQERKDVMGGNEITNWDAEISIKTNMTIAESQAWYNKMDDLFNRGVIKEGDIRTYDKKKELKSTGTNFEFAKADGNFPKAKEVVDESGNIGRMILTNLGYQNIDDAKAKALGLKIIDMTVSRGADNKTFSTRNTYPAIRKGVPREKQAEPEVCSIYEPKTQVSHEHFVGNILHESNDAPWNFDFNLSPSGFKSKYTELKVLKLTDAQNKTQTLSWRLFDYGSQPNTEAQMIAPENFDQYVWGSEIKKPCGPGRATKAPVSAPTVPSQPGINESPAPSPTKPFVLPTPAPTNVDAPFATNTAQPAPTFDAPPTKAG